MSSVSERIETIIKELGHNKNSFSKAIGLGNNVTIGRIINEKRDPSFEVLEKILHTFGHTINAKWLLTGEGQMKNDSAGMVMNDPAHSYPSSEKKDDLLKILTHLEFLSESMTSELKKLKSKI